jgi:hypothetical protein
MFSYTLWESAEPEANGKIVQKVESVFMEPTEFSQLK